MGHIPVFRLGLLMISRHDFNRRPLVIPSPVEKFQPGSLPGLPRSVMVMMMIAWLITCSMRWAILDLMYSYMNFARNASSTVAVQFCCYTAMQNSLHKTRLYLCWGRYKHIENKHCFFYAIPFLDQSQGLCVILGRLWIMWWSKVKNAVLSFNRLFIFWNTNHFFRTTPEQHLLHSLQFVSWNGSPELHQNPSHWWSIHQRYCDVMDDAPRNAQGCL